MMRNAARGALLTALLAVAVPGTAKAQFGRPVYGNCGGQSCGLPPSTCGCAVPLPTLQTSFRQENVLTYQDVTRVGVRQETHVESVPITQFDQVTVDEGSYQTVWVPRPVTRTVARTTLQPRLAQRTVPYVYTERVPQLATRLVPQQTVQLSPPSIVLNAVPASTVLRPAAVIGPAVVLQAPVPVISSAPMPQAPLTASEGWTKLASPGGQPQSSPTGGSGVELQSPLVPDPLPVPEIGYDDSVTAPSAARVWQSTQRTVPARW